MWTPDAGSGKHTHLNGGQGLAAGPNVDGGQTYEPGWVASDDGNIAPTNGNLSCSGSPNYSTWTGSVEGDENRPINCANWYEAYAFCIWDGGFRPSEAEWEYAAAGGSAQRQYPWGATDPSSAPTDYAIYSCYWSGSCGGVESIAPVGTATLGAGAWGQLDLAGDVTEWNLDWNAPFVDPCADCAYLTGSVIRVDRGGYFGDLLSDLQPGLRVVNYYKPTGRNDENGFRCARTP